MATIKQRKAFGCLVTDAIRDCQLDKKAIADDLGIGLTTLYRILNGTTRIDKPTIAALVRVVNRLAGRSLLNEPTAFISAGYKLNGFVRDPAEIRTDLVELISTHAARLPESVQEDILAMIRALEKKHVSKRNNLLTSIKCSAVAR